MLVGHLSDKFSKGKRGLEHPADELLIGIDNTLQSALIWQLREAIFTHWITWLREHTFQEGCSINIQKANLLTITLEILKFKIKPLKAASSF
jgi:hypothetical protein